MCLRSVSCNSKLRRVNCRFAASARASSPCSCVRSVSSALSSRQRRQENQPSASASASSVVRNSSACQNSPLAVQRLMRSLSSSHAAIQNAAAVNSTTAARSRKLRDG